MKGVLILQLIRTIFTNMWRKCILVLLVIFATISLLRIKLVSVLINFRCIPPVWSSVPTVPTRPLMKIIWKFTKKIDTLKIWNMSKNLILELTTLIIFRKGVTNKWKLMIKEKILILILIIKLKKTPISKGRALLFWVWKILKINLERKRVPQIRKK